MSEYSNKIRAERRMVEDWIEDGAGDSGKAPKGRKTARGILTVLPGLSINERIDQARFDRIADKNINRFRRTGDDTMFSRVAAVTDDQFGKWEWAIFQFPSHISTPSAENYMLEDAHQPASGGHFFAYAAAGNRPCDMVIATGTGPDAVLMLRGKKQRILDLGERGGHTDGVPPTTGFLGVRKR